MILNFDRGYGQSPEQMIQSLMESTQMAFDTLERKLSAAGVEISEDTEGIEYVKNGDSPSFGAITSSGTVTASSFRVDGHGSAIGYSDSGSYTKSSLASGTTMTKLTSDLTLSAGTWLVMASVRYGTMSSHNCCAQWYADGEAIGASRVTGFSSGACSLETVAVHSSDSSMTLNVYGYQNSGSAQSNIAIYYRWVRIA